jgi:hypothetical protein
MQAAAALQMVAAITQVMFIAYNMDVGREIALSGCFAVFLFGLFRLNAREFASAEALVKAADAAMYGAKQSGNAPLHHAA